MLKKSLFGICAILAIATFTACGGGGDSSSNTSGTSSGSSSYNSSSSTSSMSISGVVVDGYIRGAQVCIDLNANNVCDAGEPSVKTGIGGVFTFSNIARDLLNYPAVKTGIDGVSTFSNISGDLLNYPVLVIAGDGAVDEQRGTEFNSTAPLIMSAPAKNPNVVSPFTTMVQQAIKAGKTLEAAQASVAAELDLAPNVLFTDFIKTGNTQMKAQGAVLADSMVSNKGVPSSTAISEANTTGNFVKDINTTNSLFANATLGTANVANMNAAYAMADDLEVLISSFTSLGNISGISIVGSKKVGDKTVTTIKATNAQIGNLLINGSFELANQMSKSGSDYNSTVIFRPIGNLGCQITSGTYKGQDCTLQADKGANLIISKYAEKNGANNRTVEQVVDIFEVITPNVAMTAKNIYTREDVRDAKQTSGSGLSISKRSGNYYQYSANQAVYESIKGEVTSKWSYSSATSSVEGVIDCKMTGSNGSWATLTTTDTKKSCDTVTKDSSGASVSNNTCTTSSY